MFLCTIVLGQDGNFNVIRAKDKVSSQVPGTDLKLEGRDGGKVVVTDSLDIEGLLLINGATLESIVSGKGNVRAQDKFTGKGLILITLGAGSDTGARDVEARFLKATDYSSHKTSLTMNTVKLGTRRASEDDSDGDNETLIFGGGGGRFHNSRGEELTSLTEDQLEELYERGTTFVLGGIDSALGDTTLLKVSNIV